MENTIMGNVGQQGSSEIMVLKSTPSGPAVLPVIPQSHPQDAAEGEGRRAMLYSLTVALNRYR